jgi:hypothetical protein
MRRFPVAFWDLYRQSGHLARQNALLQHLGETAAEMTKRFANVTPATIGAIQRRLLGNLLELTARHGLASSVFVLLGRTLKMT